MLRCASPSARLPGKCGRTAACAGGDEARGGEESSAAWFEAKAPPL